MTKWIYGIVMQSITEALPISSSLHLQLLRYKQSDMQTAILHFATGLISIFLCKSEIYNLIYGFSLPFIGVCNIWTKLSYYFLYIITIPILCIGFCLHKSQVTWPNQLSGMLSIVCGIFLFITDIYFPETHKSLSKFSLHHALILSLFQSLAFIPGVSRLGSAYTILRLFSFHRVVAYKTAILLGIIPSIASIYPHLNTIHYRSLTLSNITLMLQSMIIIFIIYLYTILTVLKNLYILSSLGIYRAIFGLFLLFR